MYPSVYTKPYEKVTFNFSCHSSSCWMQQCEKKQTISRERKIRSGHCLGCKKTQEE